MRPGPDIRRRTTACRAVRRQCYQTADYRAVLHGLQAHVVVPSGRTGRTVTSQGSTGVDVGNVAPARKGRGERSNRTVNIERIALPLFWIIEIAIFSLIKPHLFLTTSNFSSIFGSQAVVAVLALAVLAPALAGDYDLSCASNLVLSSMLVAILTVNDHWPLAAAAAIAIIIGIFVGLVNGWLVTEFQIESLIVTLGTGTVLQGIVIWISNSATISGVSPGLVSATISDKLFGIPYEFYYVVALALVMWYVFEFTPLGRSAALCRTRAGRGAAFGSSGRASPHGSTRCFRPSERAGGNPVRRLHGLSGSKFGVAVPASRFRGSVPRRHLYPTWQIQSVGDADSNLFPGYRNHWPRTTRGRSICPGRVLRRRPRAGGSALSDCSPTAANGASELTS